MHTPSPNVYAYINSILKVHAMNQSANCQRIWCVYFSVLIKLDAPFIIHHLNPIVVELCCSTQNKAEESGIQRLCKLYNIEWYTHIQPPHRASVQMQNKRAHTYAQIHIILPPPEHLTIIYLSRWFNFSRDLCFVMMTIIGWSIFLT